jgi:hypothetical protein
MFLITWVFDRLGYMPKIDTAWSFPEKRAQVEKKPTVKKATARKPTVKKTK